jgi:hypothetical protein
MKPWRAFLVLEPHKDSRGEEIAERVEIGDGEGFRSRAEAANAALEWADTCRRASIGLLVLPVSGSGISA